MINAYHLYKFSFFLNKLHLTFLAKIVKFIIFIVYNSSIPYQSKIGKGTRFAYGGIGVIIHKNATIGENVMIGSNVTIGGKSPHVKVPVIKNSVFISTGAKIIGPITIGENSIIGANAVVIKDVPDNAVVAGVPAKILKYNKVDKT